MTGLGDFSAVGVLPEAISTIQMLAGMTYSVLIISHTQGLFDHTSSANVDELSMASRSKKTFFRQCWLCISRNSMVRGLRLFLRRYLVLVSITIYMCNLAWRALASDPPLAPPLRQSSVQAVRCLPAVSLSEC